MADLLRRRDMGAEEVDHLLYSLPEPKTFASGVREDTGVAVSKDKPFTICARYNLQKVSSASAPSTILGVLWELKNSGNTSATAIFRHYLKGVYNWTQASSAGDARVVIVSTPSTVIVYSLNTSGAVQSVSRNNWSQAVSETVQFGNISGGTWYTFDLYDYAFSADEAGAFLNA